MIVTSSLHRLDDYGGFITAGALLRYAGAEVRVESRALVTFFYGMDDNSLPLLGAETSCGKVFAVGAAKESRGRARWFTSLQYTLSLGCLEGGKQHHISSRKSRKRVQDMRMTV